MVFANDPSFGGSSPVIAGGVVQDSSGNILDRELAPTYSQINMYNKANDLENALDKYFEENPTSSFYENQVRNTIYGPEGGSVTANDIVNDITRGESSNLESSRDYLERITGLIANGIYTAKEQNALNLSEAEKVREYNAIEAEKARAYQLMLRDTQVQSTMKQLKEAGINPLLAFGSLGYANASSSAQASSSHTTFGNDNSIVSALILAVASAIGSITKMLGLAL